MKGIVDPEGAIGSSLFGGAFTFPVMVARRSALEHNIATLAAFAREHGLLFAPHAKTTMSPELVRAQLDAGAWGMTAATPSQVLTLREFGVSRIVLANQVFDPAGLDAIAAQLAADDSFEFLCFADSVAGIEALSRHAGARPFQVLAELGHQGGRAGSRTLGELLEVAAAAQAAEGVELAGVAGYEGALGSAGEVRAYLHRLLEALEHLRVRAPILSVGGSQWFDVIGRELAACQARIVLRSGAYISHDDGYYRERTPYTRIEGELRAALEIWAHVLSVPEPGLAVVGFGKRDAPFDEGLPVPRGAVADATVLKVQDQHAMLRLPPGSPVKPGDLVCFGISHPCTAFDKWRVMPVVDDDYVVVDLINTCF
ncbi:D-serine deaminase-like pyridoxal phosphate-dependent protein [Streptosporangium becharense]|uniref:D-serine deaminase-like pyridoxal phosphate-dependent protein n=1 Tax=Streptosporangium becharense TaxID=1816182 RepID=A0A7W9MFV7_9ACTN|nr:alanine racemase [Streptosporangium becharense]MBB2909855.1 D-serine deaminase-like pyridoxal phosphate-dependent protein [Streptosporangium becharense]MBB5819190.1 D-serine deaminase-like pyridoxal phosphate-dependent protein [Streptosporangium becharense]